MRPAHVLCDIRLQRAQSNYSVFKVREVFALTNQLGTFFGNTKRIFKKFFRPPFRDKESPYHITEM